MGLKYRPRVFIRIYVYVYTRTYVHVHLAPTRKGCTGEVVILSRRAAQAVKIRIRLRFIVFDVFYIANFIPRVRTRRRGVAVRTHTVLWQWRCGTFAALYLYFILLFIHKSRLTIHTL